MDLDTTDPPQTHLCAFCHKPEQEVEALIAGPGCYICSECVELCNAIIADQKENPDTDWSTWEKPGR